MNDVICLWWFSGLSILPYDLHRDKSKVSRGGMHRVSVSLSSPLTGKHGSSDLVSLTLVFSSIKWMRCITNVLRLLWGLSGTSGAGHDAWGTPLRSILISNGRLWKMPGTCRAWLSSLLHRVRNTPQATPACFPLVYFLHFCRLNPIEILLLNSPRTSKGETEGSCLSPRQTRSLYLALTVQA